MFKISSVIIFRNMGEPYFFSSNCKLSSEMKFEVKQEIQGGNTANLFLDKENRVLYKFFQSKKKKGFLRLLSENIDKYFWVTSGGKEYRGNKLLKNAGLHVPHRIGTGFPLRFFSPYKAVYIQSFIVNAISLKKFLTEVEDSDKRELILKKIAADIATLIENNIYYRDLTPNNVLVDDETIYWIDTSAKKILFKFVYHPKTKKKLANFIERIKKASATDQEIDCFLNRIPSVIK